MSINIRLAALTLGLLAVFAFSPPAFAHTHHKHKTHATSTDAPLPPSGGNDSQGGSAY